MTLLVRGSPEAQGDTAPPNMEPINIEPGVNTSHIEPQTTSGSSPTPGEPPPVPEPEIRVPDEADQILTGEHPAQAEPVDEVNPEPEMDVEDMDSDEYSNWAANHTAEELNLLRSVISNRTLSTCVLTSDIYDAELVDIQNSPFMPIFMHVPHIDDGHAWIQKQAEIWFGSDVTLCLTPTGEPQRPDRNSAPHEIIMHIREVSETGLETLEYAKVRFEGMPMSGVWTPPRPEKRWLEGALVVSVANSTDAVNRDLLYNECRLLIQSKLMEAHDSMWISDQGWVVKDSDPNCDYDGYSPYAAYLLWKQMEQYNKTPWTEHSTHAVWKLSTPDSATSSFQGMRIIHAEKKKPIDLAVTIRFPIVLTDIIKEAMRGLNLQTECKITVSDAIFVQSAITALTAKKLSEKSAQRMYMMRVAIPTDKAGWDHPKETFQLLLDHGFNVGAVEHRHTEVRMRQGKGTITIAKLVLGTDNQMGATKLSTLVTTLGGQATRWEYEHGMRPVKGIDYFESEGKITVYDYSVPKQDIVSTLMQRLSRQQEDVTIAVMDGDSEYTQELMQSLRDVKAEVNRQDACRVRAQQELLKKMAQEEGLAPPTRRRVPDRDHPRAPQENTLTVWCANGEVPEVKQAFFRIRVAKLERYRSDAGIMDLVDFMVLESMIPRGFFANTEQIESAIETLGEDGAEGAPVIMKPYMNGEDVPMVWDRFKNARVKEIWEDGERLTMHFSLATDQQSLKLASTYLRATVDSAPREPAAPVPPAQHEANKWPTPAEHPNSFAAVAPNEEDEEGITDADIKAQDAILASPKRGREDEETDQVSAKFSQQGKTSGHDDEVMEETEVEEESDL